MTGRKKARRGEYELKQENGRQRILGTIDYQRPAQASAACAAPLARLLFEQPARVEPLPEAIDPMVRWGALLAHPESMAAFRVHVEFSGFARLGPLFVQLDGIRRKVQLIVGRGR